MTTKSHDNKKVEMASVTYDLVKGDFAPDDASDIVNELFNTKINYHKLKNLSQLIRTESKDSHQIDRITELRSTQQQSKELMKQARETGKSIRLYSTISIELI